MAETEQDFDVAVVGGGPAGLTAALFLARYLHSVVVIDSGDPRNWAGAVLWRDRASLSRL